MSTAHKPGKAAGYPHCPPQPRTHALPISGRCSGEHAEVCQPVRNGNTAHYPLVKTVFCCYTMFLGDKFTAPQGQRGKAGTWRKGSPMTYVFADCLLDTQLYTLRRAGRVLQLRPKVFQTLTYLLDHHDRVVSKQELTEKIWPEQFISDATLESCIKLVRQALGDTGRTQQFVQTLHGHGYRFVVPVDILPEAQIPRAPGIEPGAAAASRPLPTPAVQPPLRKLLDKSKTSQLLQAFLDLVPDLSSCWIIEPDGQCIAGSPDKTSMDFSTLFDQVAQTHTAVTLAPYSVYPVLLSGALLGAIVVQQKRSESAPDVLRMLRLLSAALTQSAVFGLERTAILRDALDKYREISLLYTIAEAIGASLSTGQLAQLVLDTSHKIVRTEHGSVMLRHPETDILEIQAARGVEHPRKAVLKTGIGIAGLVVQTGRAEIVNDTHSDARFVQYTGTVRSLLCVPLKTNEHILGVVNLSNPLSGRMFTARDEKFLITLASQAAIAMENACLMEALRTQNAALERSLQQRQTPRQTLRWPGFPYTGQQRYGEENPDSR